MTGLMHMDVPRSRLREGQYGDPLAPLGAGLREQTPPSA